MKAAVLKSLNSTPTYQEFDEPKPENDQQQILHVKAAPLKYLDKLMTKKSFYGSYENLPVVAGTDGVGVLDDGRRVYAQGITGMFAEKAVIPTNNFTELPDDLDFVTAAAIPNAVQGSALPLRVRGNLKKGDTVLINGATGFTGQMAVQAAKHYGASRIIATGQDEERLELLKDLGADSIISLAQFDKSIRKKLNEILEETPINIVLDYLWGGYSQLIINELADASSTAIRFVNVGHMAGPTLSLDAGTIRSSKIEILGAGLGSYTKEEFNRLTTEFVPEMFELAATGKLTVNTHEEPLENIETLWEQEIQSGERLVLTI